jgi:hypothetical protein
MKLRGKWVTVNSITRFVRDPDPVKPKRTRVRKQDAPVLRAHDVTPQPRKKKPKTRGIFWQDIPNDIRLAHLTAHDDLVRRRLAGEYDRVTLTPYAVGLLASAGRYDLTFEGIMLASVSLGPAGGCRMKGFWIEDVMENRSLPAIF